VFDENVFPARATRSESQRLAETNAESLSEVDRIQSNTDSDAQNTHTASGIAEPSAVNDADSDIAENNSVYATANEAVLENADEIADSNSDQSIASAGHAVAEEEDESLHSTADSRYPSRLRRPPGTWWAFQANSKDCHLNEIHEPLVAIAEQACHMRKEIDSDEPSLKEALNSSNHDLWKACTIIDRWLHTFGSIFARSPWNITIQLFIIIVFELNICTVSLLNTWRVSLNFVVNFVFQFADFG
jgi:hypothetical protein